MPAPRIYRLGDGGPAVVDIKQRLTQLGLLTEPQAAVEPTAEVFDATLDRAVRNFQQQRGLIVDGLVGPQTIRTLDEAHWGLGDRLLQHQVSHPLRGDDVASLQQRLSDMGFNPGRADGIFGAQTSVAVQEFQRNTGLAPDGTCGPATLAAFDRLTRTSTGGAPVAGEPTALREHEAIRRFGATPAGRVVVVDAGHGGPDSGCVSRVIDGLNEADIAYDIAARIEGRLTALGANAFLSRPRDLDAELDEQSRAEFANEARADLVISIHSDSLANEAARGVATYYYGADRAGAHSAVGERLAHLIQDEIVSRTDLIDGRTHRKTWDLLRWTKMPAVRVEVGYLSSPVDAARLSDPAFRDAVAEAVVAGVHQLFTADPTDA